MLKVKTMSALATGTIDKTRDLTILQRIAEGDKTAVEEFIDAYGDFIWSLARKYTCSPEAAATATEEIFTDIWQYRDSARGARPGEEKLIAMIALSRLFKSSRQAKQMSVASIGTPNEQGAGTDRISDCV